jgi:hypothetical protein
VSRWRQLCAALAIIIFFLKLLRRQMIVDFDRVIIVGLSWFASHLEIAVLILTGIAGCADKRAAGFVTHWFDLLVTVTIRQSDGRPL